MIRYTSIISFCLLILSSYLSSCDDDKSGLASTGYLYFGVEADNTTQTKAIKPVTNEALKVFIKASSGDTVKTYDDYLEEVKGKKLLLPVGNYTVGVSSNHSGMAAWDSPFYAGVSAEPVEIKAEQITNTSVTCKISNTKVTVSYSDKLKETFVDYCDTVSTSSGTLIFTRDEYRAGYFAAEGDLTANLYLKNKDGNEFTLKRVIRDIKPQYHYNLIYKLSNEGNGDIEAGADIDVSIGKDNPTEINCTIQIKEEDLAGIPKFELKGFTDSKISYRPLIDGIQQTPPSALLELNIPAGIQSVSVKANSLQFEDLPQFDLTSWDRAAQKGFPVIDKESKGKQILDFSSLLSELKSDGNKLAIHSFVMDLIDNANQELKISFSFEIKPDVKASTEEPVVWSSFAVLKGNAGDLTNTSFIIREQGGSDISVSENIVKDESAGSFSALVTGLVPGKTYEYQAVAGENKGDFIAFTLQMPSVVPNLNFDDWGTRKGHLEAPVVGGKYDYKSPNSDSQREIYWESGNLGAAGAGKVLTEGVTDVAVEGSKKAARLTSTWAGKMGIGAFAAGSVFSGIAKEVTSAGARLLYGQPYVGAPTSLRGYYKYSPGKINYTKGKEGQTSNSDEALIYVAVVSKPFEVISRTDQIKRFTPSDDSVIAYGELRSQKKIDVYTEFEIPIIYKKDFPKNQSHYIIIVATSSSNGDEFTGATGSVLFVDEFSLSYDYNQESLSGTIFKDYQPNQAFK